MRKSLCGILVCLVLAAGGAQAAVLSVSGPIAWLGTPPASVRADQLESNSVMFLFQEQAGVSVSPIFVDISTPGTYTRPYTNASSLIPGGLVDSYFVHFDVVGNTISRSLQNATITFDSDVLGLMILSNTLSAGDPVFGNPGTLYSVSTLKGLEFSDPTEFDSITLAADRRTVTINQLWVGNGLDQIRIITAAVVPLPPALLCFGAALAALGSLRRAAAGGGG